MLGRNTKFSVDGLIVNKGVVIEASGGKETSIGKDEYKRDYEIGVEIVIQCPEKSYPDEMTIAGNFSKDRKGWGSAFKVESFLIACDSFPEDGKLNDDYSIPEEWLKNCIGKEVKFLVYRTTNSKGNGGFYWNKDRRVYAPETDDEVIKNQFKNSYGKSGFPMNYNPTGKAVTEEGMPETNEAVIEQATLPGTEVPEEPPF